MRSPVLADGSISDADRAPICGRLGIEIVDVGGERVATLDPDPVLIDPHGHVNFGALAILTDLAGSMAVSDHAAGSPFLHADMTLHRLAPAAGPMTARPHLVWAGERNGIVQVDVIASGGRRIASSTHQITFPERFPDLEADGIEFCDDVDELFTGRCTLRESLQDALGIDHDGETWIMGAAPDRVDGSGALHGGVATALVDAAAVGAAGARHAGPVRVVSAAVRYLGPGTDGPYTARPEVLSADDRIAVVRVPVTGADGVIVLQADVDVALL